MTTQFDNIFLSATPREGRLRLAEASGLGWKSYDKDEPESNVVMLPRDEIKWALWTRVARNFQITIGQKKSEERLVFDNFHRDDYDPLNKIFKAWGHELEPKETSLRGWNWGAVDVQGPNLAFLVAQRQAFLLPLRSIANSNIAGRTEVSLEVAPPAAAGQGGGGGGPAKEAKRPVDELVELRFHVPGMTGGSDDEDEGEDGEGARAGAAAGGGEERVSKAQAFHEMIKERAAIGDVGTPGVVVFNEVLVLTPRGRYDVDMFLTHFRLRGKTYDYKILHSSVTRLFLLPKADEIHVQLVVGLDPPIRQGQTRYPYLVMQFTKDEEMDAELNLSEDELTKHGLRRTYEAPAYQVVSQVFKALTGRKITPPSAFMSTSGQNVVKCNLKANQGELYLLDKALIFIARQPLLVDFANVQTVSFSRVGGAMASSKTFDLSISLKARTDGGSDYSFTSLAKDDAGPIKAFLEARKVRVKDRTEEDGLGAAGGLSDGDEEMSDEEEEDEDEDSDEEGGKKKAKGGGKGKEKASVAAVSGADLDDDDESDDEDFQASSSDGGSASSSSDDDDDDDGDAPMKDASAAASKGGKKAKKSAEGPARKKAKVEDA